MNIGEAAKRSGLPAKTIRFYEQIGLIAPSRRQDNNYRDYDEQDVHRLRFVARARALGFGVEQCRELLALYADRARASADVKALALRHIGEIDARIAELEAMKATLRTLAERCQGDERPDCPILEGLARSAG
ncbi:MAG: Cu(I)-responsive transcriptional regulator [Pseudomonadota bacterium]